MFSTENLDLLSEFTKYTSTDRTVRPPGQAMSKPNFVSSACSSVFLSIGYHCWPPDGQLSASLL